MTLQVIAWIDTGKDLLQGPDGPWTEHLQPLVKRSDQRAFLPIIQVRPGAGIKPYLHSIQKDQRPAANLAQSSALLHLKYGKTLNKKLMANDAFYAFQELFLFSAFSHNQLLNMVESDIMTDSGEFGPKELGLGQSNYIYIQEFLERQIVRLEENVKALKSRGGPMWPQADDGILKQQSIAAAQVLEQDFEYLVKRSSTLIERCKSKLSHLATRALLEESKRGIEQAEEVTNLTRLAFVFIPLSFTASFFGMNLDPIVKGSNPLWIWFAVSIPLILLSIAFMKRDLGKFIWSWICSINSAR